MAKKYLPVILVLLLLVFAGCGDILTDSHTRIAGRLVGKTATSNGCLGSCTVWAKYPDIDRISRIPADCIKRGPDTDRYPPMMHSTEYEAPVPLPAAINTAGAEDSPFILPDGNALYFFFTPDVRLPPEGQILDEVSGVWVSRNQNNQWNNAERVWLQDPGKLALDGAVCIQGEEMWFASAREGYEGVNMFTAIWKKDRWAKWRYVGDRLMKEIQIGEVHLHKDTLYFHSPRPGGKGNYDIWTTCREGKNWTDPVNISAMNTEAMDGYPYVSADQSMLWFTRMHEGSPAIFRSKNMEGAWSTPELVVSRFAGEPTLDAEGNLYFVHHYYENDIMIEADIYMAKKR